MITATPGSPPISLFAPPARPRVLCAGAVVVVSGVGPGAKPPTRMRWRAPPHGHGCLTSPKLLRTVAAVLGVRR